jgi:hypothetical protein
MANAVIKMVKPVLKPVALGLLNTRQSLLGNSVGFLDHGYGLIRSMTMRVYTPAGFKAENYDARADQLKTDGYVSMSGFYDPELIAEVREEFGEAMNNDALTNRQPFSKTLKTNIDFEEHLPSLFKLVRKNELLKILHSYYNSPCNLTMISATRLFHIPEQERTFTNMLSAVWHCDNIPTDVVHMAIFLHDVTPEYGPTQLVSRQRTKQLMSMGYGRRHNIGVAKEVLEDPRYVKDLSSKAGATHLMLPCQTLHRAGVPQEGLIRDSLFLSFRPGLESKQLAQASPLKRKIYPTLQRMGEDWFKNPSTAFKDKNLIYVP